MKMKIDCDECKKEIGTKEEIMEDMVEAHKVERNKTVEILCEECYHEQPLGSLEEDYNADTYIDLSPFKQRIANGASAKNVIETYRIHGNDDRKELMDYERRLYETETFEAKVYDPMMQKKIDQNECTHLDGDGEDAWNLVYSDIDRNEFSYVYATVKCDICNQERYGSWGINEKEGFEIVKGEEGRMPKMYGFYGAETYDFIHCSNCLFSKTGLNRCEVCNTEFVCRSQHGEDCNCYLFTAETKISKTCPNCEKYGRDATTDYICDFCAQCKRCCETSYGCYDVAICNDCDGSFIGKDIDGCCGSCDDCCECDRTYDAETFNALDMDKVKHQHYKDMIALLESQNDLSEMDKVKLHHYKDMLRIHTDKSGYGMICNCGNTSGWIVRSWSSQEQAPEGFFNTIYHIECPSCREYVITYQRNDSPKSPFKMNAETFDVEFNEWADQELMSHGKDISFKDWAQDEGMKHGNTEITEWAQHEDESHDARFNAEIPKELDCKDEPYEHSTELNNIYDLQNLHDWSNTDDMGIQYCYNCGQYALTTTSTRIMSDEEYQELRHGYAAEGKKRSGLLSEPFEGTSLDSGEWKGILTGFSIGLLGLFGYSKLRK